MAAVTGAPYLNSKNQRIPNEVTLSILSYLGKLDLKSTRLTCKALASIGAQLLIGNLYISPRTIDMDAFMGITKDADLKRSVKNLVYDSAVFEKFPSAYVDYTQALWNELQDEDDNPFVRLGDADNLLRQYFTDAFEKEDQCNEAGQARHRQTHRYIGHPTFIKGFLDYGVYAAEQGRIHDRLWFDKICTGLRQLGPVQSVTIWNSWNMIYATPADFAQEDLTGYREYDIVSVETLRLLMPRRHLLEDHVRQDGMRPVGSPSARAWTPTGLPPSTPKTLKQTSTLSQMLTNGSSDGWFEFLQVVKHLRSSGIKPKEFSALGDWNSNFDTGLPPFTFNSTESPESMPFLDLAESIHTLQLKLSICNGPTRARRFPSPDLLRTFLAKAKSLKVLSLALPYEEVDNTRSKEEPYRCLQVLPSVAKWNTVNPTDLHLEGLSIPYCDLVHLLFWSVPHLVALELSNIVLTGTDAHWEDIVGGLRDVSSIQRCILGQVLRYNGDNYYTAPPPAVVNHTERVGFARSNARYIVEGGRHPFLPEGKPDGDSNFYLRRLNKTLNDIRLTS
ncbi:MAG: hypothetical protein Q9198_001416 [Flavoplaca austrocitrina]